MNVNLLDAFSYPIRRSGWIMILVGAIFSVILDLLQFAPLTALGLAFSASVILEPSTSIS